MIVVVFTTEGNFLEPSGNWYKGISPKMSWIEWLEFEIAYFEVPDQYVSHYTIGSPTTTKVVNKQNYKATQKNSSIRTPMKKKNLLENELKNFDVQ